jgi:hypothetical protein
MKATDTVLVTATYHPNSGYEKDFITLWESKIKPIALKHGANWACIYHNEETEEFIFTSHWGEKKLADTFLLDKEFLKILKDLNKISLIPPSRAVYDFLREAA